MLTVFLTCVYSFIFFFSMHICGHVKDKFPLLFAGDNKVFLILIQYISVYILLPKIANMETFFESTNRKKIK